MTINIYTPNMTAIDITPTTRHMIINMQQHRLNPAPIEDTIAKEKTMRHIHGYYSLQDMNTGIQHELLYNPTYRHMSTLKKLETCKHYQKELTKEYLTLIKYLKTVSTPQTRVLHQWIQQLEANYLNTSQLWGNMITYYQHHLTEETKEKPTTTNNENIIPLI